MIRQQGQMAKSPFNGIKAIKEACKSQDGSKNLFNWSSNFNWNAIQNLKWGIDSCLYK